MCVCVLVGVGWGVNSPGALEATQMSHMSAEQHGGRSEPCVFSLCLLVVLYQLRRSLPSCPSPLRNPPGILEACDDDDDDETSEPSVNRY